MIDQNNQSEHFRKFENYRITTPHHHLCFSSTKLSSSSYHHYHHCHHHHHHHVVAVNASTGRTWPLLVHPTHLSPRVASLHRRLHPVWQVSCFQEMKFLIFC